MSVFLQCFTMTALRQRKGSKGKEPPLGAELQSQQANCCTDHHPEKILHGERTELIFFQVAGPIAAAQSVLWPGWRPSTPIPMKSP